MTARTSLAIALALMTCGSSARADSFMAPPIHQGPKVSIQAYGKQNPDCLNWTNGCVLCTTDAGGRSQCSTPGIACQPRGLTCKVLRPK